MIRMDTNLSNLSFMRSGTLSEIDILFARRNGVMVRKYFFFFFPNEYVFDNGRETGKLNSMGQMPLITGFKLEKQSLTNYSHYCVFLEL